MQRHLPNTPFASFFLPRRKKRKVNWRSAQENVSRARAMLRGAMIATRLKASGCARQVPGSVLVPAHLGLEPFRTPRFRTAPSHQNMKTKTNAKSSKILIPSYFPTPESPLSFQARRCTSWLREKKPVPEQPCRANSDLFFFVCVRGYFCYLHLPVAARPATGKCKKQKKNKHEKQDNANKTAEIKGADFFSASYTQTSLLAPFLYVLSPGHINDGTCWCIELVLSLSLCCYKSFLQNPWP